VLIRIQDVETHYREAGAGSPVLLLHGWGSSSEALAGVAAALAAGFRVVSVDLPGFGWSQPPAQAWGIGEYTAHARGLLDALQISTAAVVGHSFGGRIAIALAARHPARVARLVLVAGAGVRPPRGAKARLLTGTTRLLRLLARLPGAGRPMERALARWLERVGSRDYRQAGRMRPTLVRVVNEDLAPLLPQIKAPTLLLWGDRDQEVGRPAVELMAQQIPEARMVVFPGAGHFPFQDAPDAFQRELTGFLQAGGSW
jgi:pimeloyl-ACP methyl ester carboxylesterase